VEGIIMDKKELRPVIAVFEENLVRTVRSDGKSWYSVIDVIRVLTDSTKPKQYWLNIKNKEPQLSSILGRLKMPSDDGKMRVTDCANEEGILRIIQSVPSPKAEPFKKWLAQLGKERLEETKNPELGIVRAADRMRAIFKKRGYSDDWIDGRIAGIGARKAFTRQIKEAGVTAPDDYARLTNKVHTDAMGLSVSAHKSLKGVTTGNLRDHMTERELGWMLFVEADLRDRLKKLGVTGYHDIYKAAKERDYLYSFQQEKSMR
jgi:DNA-damage-inducible protein D